MTLFCFFEGTYLCASYEDRVAEFENQKQMRVKEEDSHKYLLELFESVNHHGLLRAAVVTPEEKEVFNFKTAQLIQNIGVRLQGGYQNLTFVDPVFAPKAAPLSVAFSYWKELFFERMVVLRDIDLEFNEYYGRDPYRRDLFFLAMKLDLEEALPVNLRANMNREKFLEEELKRAEAAVLFERRLLGAQGMEGRPDVDGRLLGIRERKICEAQERAMQHMIGGRYASYESPFVSFREIILARDTIMTRQEKAQLKADHLFVKNLGNDLMKAYLNYGNKAQTAHAGSALLNARLKKVVEIHHRHAPLPPDMPKFPRVKVEVLGLLQGKPQYDPVRKALETAEKAPKGVDAETQANVQNMLTWTVFIAKNVPTSGSVPHISPSLYGMGGVIATLVNQEGTCLAGAGNRFSKAYVMLVRLLLEFKLSGQFVPEHWGF